MPEIEKTPMADNRTANRSQRLLLASTILNLSLALGITVMLGRALEPAEYGFFAMVTAIFMLSRDLLDLGTSNVATREIVRDQTLERSILERLLGWRRIKAGLLALICLGFALMQEADYQVWVLVAAAVVLFLFHFGALMPVFQVRQQFGWPVLLNVIGQVCLFIICTLLIVLGGPTVIFPFLVVAREAFVIIATKIKAIQILGFKPVPTVSGKGSTAFFGQVLAFGLAALFYNLYFHSGTFLVWFFLSAEELGGYSAAFRPIQPLFSFPWLYMVPLIPVLSWLAEKDPAKFVNQIRGNFSIAIGVGAIGVVTGVCLGPQWVDLLYDGKYSTGPLSAFQTLQWLCLSFGFACVNPLLVSGLLAVGEEKNLLKLSAVGLVLNMVCNSLLLPRYGFTSAGFSSAITEFFIFSGGIALLSRSMKKDLWDSQTPWYLLPAFLLLLVYKFIPHSSVISLSLATGLSFVSVLALWKTRIAKNYRRELALVVPESYSQATQ